jgi:N-acetyl-anhydromuramoyl-L-alanine amidase
MKPSAFRQDISIDRQTGLIGEALYVPSPNCDDRPLDSAIDLLVIHNISLPPGEFGGPHIDALFSNTLDPTLHPYFAGIASAKVSSHCLIRRDGQLVQYVPFHKRAWHAGESCFMGREHCNDYSIGIELEGTDTVPYTTAQYRVLSALILALHTVYPDLSVERIVGHSTIAPSRKTDPGPAFEWATLQGLIENYSESIG